MIRIECKCGQVLVAEDRLAGSAVACPQCQRRVELPSEPARPPRVQALLAGLRDRLSGARLLGLALGVLILATAVLPWMVLGQPTGDGEPAEWRYVFSWQVIADAPAMVGAAAVGVWIVGGAVAGLSLLLPTRPLRVLDLLGGLLTLALVAAGATVWLGSRPQPDPGATAFAVVAAAGIHLLLPVLIAVVHSRPRGLPGRRARIAQVVAGAGIALLATGAMVLAVSQYAALDAWAGEVLPGAALCLLIFAGMLLLAGVLGVAEAVWQWAASRRLWQIVLALTYLYVGGVAIFAIVVPALLAETLAWVLPGLSLCAAWIPATVLIAVALAGIMTAGPAKADTASIAPAAS